MKKKYVIKFLLCAFLILIIFSNCKSHKDYFPIQIGEVISVNLIAIDSKGIYQSIDKSYSIRDDKTIENIVKMLNNTKNFNNDKDKDENILFQLQVKLKNETLKFPVYYNVEQKRTSILLFSNGSKGYRIGYYDVPLLYEYLKKKVNFQIVSY